MQKQFKYVYNNREVSKEEFENLKEDLFKWFDTNTINAVDYSSVSNFFDGRYKSSNQINKHLKSLIETHEEIPAYKALPFNTLVNNFAEKLVGEKEIPLSDLKQYVINGSFNLDISDIQRVLLSDSKEDIYKILKSQKKSGEKHNKGKLPMSKLFVQFPDALQAVVLASCYGHHRYPKDIDWLNFKRVPGGSQAYKDACLRHSLGAEKDEESGLPEIFHQTWNKLAELQLWLEENNINIKNFSKEYLDNLK